jgi:hypothetical protein
MKKMAVIVIVVLFSFAGVGYAKPEANVAGPLTHLALKVIYQEDLAGTGTLSKGRSLVTVTPGIDAIPGSLPVHPQPVLYIWFNLDSSSATYGALEQMNISWKSPNPSSPSYQQRIWTISCSQSPGAVSVKPQVSTTKPPPTKTNLVEGNAICTICPDGIVFDNSSTVPPNGDPTGTPTGYCVGGDPVGYGYITFTGTDYKSWDSSDQSYYTTSISVTGTLGGSSFNYIGDDWASKDGPIGDGPFPAIFSGTFAVKLTPCPLSTDTYCFITYP